MPATNAALTLAAAVTLMTLDPSASRTPGPVSVPQTASSSSGNTWVIFLDDLHLDFKATGHIRTLFTTITKQLIQDGDLYAVVSNGPSSIAIDLTRDRAPLDDAAKKISGAALKPSEIVAEGYPSETRYRAHLAFATAYEVMKNLALMPSQRKAFIYVSNGYDLDVWPGTTTNTGTNPFSLKGTEFSIERLRDEVAELTSQAKRSHVSIYGIDPRALSRPPEIDPKVDAVTWQRYWTTTRRSLEVIAEETGGFVIQDNLEEGLNHILNALRR